MSAFVVFSLGFIAGGAVVYVKYASVKKELLKLKAVIVSHAIALETVVKGDVTKVKDEAEKLLADLKKKL